MGTQDFEAMYVAELQRARSNANALVEALPALVNCAADSELAESLRAHIREMSEQIARLDQLDAMNGSTASEADGAIAGLIAKALHIAKDMDAGPLRDAALIAATQHIQHHAIATFGTLAAYAKLLGRHDEKRILGAILEEERAIDEDLTIIATELLDPLAAKVAA